MTVTLEERVEVLEGKVENLETLETLDKFKRELTGKLAEFDKAQQKQSQTLDIHTGKFNSLEGSARGHKIELFLAKSEVKQLAEEVSGKFERLDNDVSWLKGKTGENNKLVIALSADVVNLQDNISGLRNDVTGLASKVDELQADVNDLKADVAGVKADVAGVKADVAGVKADVNGIKTDVNNLKTDIAGVKADVNNLKADVAGLRTEMTEFKTEVKGTLAEILDRLPPKAA